MNNQTNQQSKNEYRGFIGKMDLLIDLIEKLIICLFGFILKTLKLFINNPITKFLSNIFIFKFIINIFKFIYNKLIYPLLSVFNKVYKKIFGNNDEIDNVSISSDSVSSDTFEKTELSETDKLATEAAKQAIVEKKKKKVRFIKRIVFLYF